ncbi:hypothetical protein Tco_1229404 [Tanacetum coccineum]
MSTYLKHMGGYTYKQLKGKSFDEIQKLFDKEMKRVNTFVAMGSEVHKSKEKKVEGSKETAKGSRKKMLRRKRAGKEQQQESLKKQRMEKNKESDKVEEVEEDDEAELKKHLVIKKDEDITINAIPLATKPPMIIDYKLHKKGIDREDLEALWRIVKTKYSDIRLEDKFERVLWGDLKVMFKPNKRSDVWRILQGYRVTIWKLIHSSGVYFVRRNLKIQKMNIKFRGGLLGLKRLYGYLEVTTAQKAQQLEPKLYVGDIIKKTNPIVIPDSKETLMLAEESQPTLSSRPTNVEVPIELPKVSMVNTSLKKLKHHIAGFDVVVKERTTPTAITEGSWGFEHTKSCFKDEIIPFVKSLKDLFNTFNHYLVDELSKVQNVFHQMEQAVEQHHLESKTFEVKMNQVLNENERLLEQVINKDIVNVIMNSSADIASVNVSECEKCLKLETELQTDFIEKEIYDKLFKTQSQEKDMVIKKLKERFKSLSGKMNEDKIKKDLEEIETINIELDHREKVLVITALMNDLRKLKGKDLADNAVTQHTIDPEILKTDVEYLNPRLLNNRSVDSNYIKHTQEEAVILREIVEQGKLQNSLNTYLDSALAVTPKNKDKRVRFTEPVTSSGYTITKIAYTSNIVSNKPMLSFARVKPSTSARRSQPSGNTKKDKIRQTPSSTQKNKVEVHPRKVNSSLKNKDCVVEYKGTDHVQHSKLNANFELKCVKYNCCMLSANHDLCVLDFINNVNARNKSKSVMKSSKRKFWKPTGKVFTNIRYIWRPTSETFTIVGNACPLTRITTTTEVPLRKPPALENETPKPVVTLVYSRKPRKSKTNVPIRKSKVPKSVSANKKEPNQSWGSKVSGVPSSSLDECKLSKLLSGIWTPAAPSI